jgi:hypothetical protein
MSLVSLVRSYFDKKSQIDQLERDRKEIKTQISTIVGDGCMDVHLEEEAKKARIQTKTRSSKKCDFDLLKQLAPEVYDQVVTEDQITWLDIRKVNCNS